MELKQTGSVSRAVVVDEGVLRRLLPLFDELERSNRSATLARHKTTEAEIEAPDLKWDHPEYQRIRDARYALGSWPLVSVNWTYTDGREFKSNSYSDLADALRDGSGDLKKLLVSTQFLNGTDARMVFENSWQESAHYSLEGDRKLVAHLKSEFDAILIDARSAFPLLHSVYPVVLIFLAFWAASFFLIVAAVEAIAPQLSSGMPQAIPIGLAAIAGLTSPSGGIFLAKYYRRAYPSCEFQFGNQGRRIVAKRTAMGVVLTAIAIPVLLALLGWT